MTEQVLCVETDWFITYTVCRLPHFRGFFVVTNEQLSQFLGESFLCWLDRDHAEKNPDYKQIIPYIIIRQKDRIFAYQRGGSEKRLDGLWSVGVGGHINTTDQDPFCPDFNQDTPEWKNPYQRGLERELAEEVQIKGDYYLDLLGIVNDDSTPVGRVHLGIVHELILHDDARLTPIDDGLRAGQMMTLEELRSAGRNWEMWSKLVLEHYLPA